ncbi:MAG: ADP-ribosylglycohydrolase family protein [Chloroflexota bacterium]
MTTDGATPSPTLADRLAGAVWGHLVGDAIGVPYEFRPPAAIGDVRFGERGTHGQPPGTWSDDGALMLALLDSLLTCGLRTDGNRTDWTYDPAIGFDVADQGRRIVAWQDEGRYTPDGDGSFDIGGTTARAIDALRRGVPAEETGPTHDRACGNGSLMRILPLALVERDVPDDVLVDHAHRASAVTHGHVRCQATCAWYVLTARRLLEGEPDPAVAFEAGRAALGRAYDAMGDAGSGYRDALAFVAGWRATHEPAGGGAAWDALWSARTAIESAGSYRETVERAIRLGDDTDTTAAIAGGLAGARWGIDAIPDGWLGGMRGREIVLPLVDRLVASAGWHTSTESPIRVDPVDLSGTPGGAGWTGRLGITFLPGKRRTGGFTGDHWRDAPRDARRLRVDLDVDTVVLLVEDWELALCRVPDLVEALAAEGIETIRFPVVDADVATDQAFATDPGGARDLIDAVESRLGDGKEVVVVCRGGLDRSGTLCGLVLRDLGLDGDGAVALVRRSRRGALLREDQAALVRAWRRGP